ncbi:unnamed protein product, partial [Larinioides sclopetarius]
VEHPHQVHRRGLDEYNPFVGDPTIRFFLRFLFAPFSISSLERKSHHHASELNAGLNGNSTDQKTAKSKNMGSMNQTEKSDSILGKIQPKRKRSDEFGAAHRKHFPFDSFPFVFHRPEAESSGSVTDTKRRATANDISAEKHFGKDGTLKTAGSLTQGKNIT